MKILLVTNILTPYRSFFYDLFYTEARKMGIDFKVFVMENRGTNNKQWSYEQYQRDYTKLLQCKRMLNNSIILNKDIIANVMVYKPDLIICAGSYQMPTVIKLALKKKKYNYKILFWSESNLLKKDYLGGVKKQLREWVRKYVYKRFDGFLYAGKASKIFIEKYAKVNTKYFFLPNLVNQELFKVAKNLSQEKKNELIKEHNLDINKKIFITPARLTYEKGMLNFLEIFKKSEHVEKATLLLIGAGVLKEKIEVFIENNPSMDIRLLGLKTQKEVVELYGIADFFLLPSIIDPNPLTCIESLWVGLPLLISNHVGNIYEVLKEGENGYYIDYSNEEFSLQAIEKAINSDKEWMNRASSLSKSIALGTYEPLSQTIRLLNELVDYVKHAE